MFRNVVEWAAGQSSEGNLEVILYFFAKPQGFLSLSSAILRQWKKCQYVGKRREEETYYDRLDRGRYRRCMLRNKERVSEASITAGNRVSSPGPLQWRGTVLIRTGVATPTWVSRLSFSFSVWLEAWKVKQLLHLLLQNLRETENETVLQ
jgi:hypothetical protein